MIDLFRDHKRFLLAALVLHLAIGALVTANFDWARHKPVVTPQLAIQARVIDQSAIRRVQDRERRVAEEKLAAERAEQEAKEREAEREANERREREEEAQRQKVAEQKAQQLAVETKQREAVQKQQREQADRQRVADIQRKQREQAKREQDKKQADLAAKEQAQRESDLKRQLAEEDSRMALANSSALAQYLALIEQRIFLNWRRPPSAQAGIQCEIKVRQARGGQVLSVQIGKCNGDQAVRQSIENAVHGASPLPQPSDARLFDPDLVINFKPSE